jgi:hypothetical protein
MPYFKTVLTLEFSLLKSMQVVFTQQDWPLVIDMKLATLSHIC